jgi:hypothetical protein
VCRGDLAEISFDQSGLIRLRSVPMKPQGSFYGSGLDPGQHNMGGPIILLALFSSE